MSIFYLSIIFYAEFYLPNKHGTNLVVLSLLKKSKEFLDTVITLAVSFVSIPIRIFKTIYADRKSFRGLLLYYFTWMLILYSYPHLVDLFHYLVNLLHDMWNEKR